LGVNNDISVFIGTTSQVDSSKIGDKDIIIYQFSNTNIAQESDYNPDTIYRLGISAVLYTSVTGNLMELDSGDVFIVGAFDSTDSVLLKIDTEK
jgi:hypothetical protein